MKKRFIFSLIIIGLSGIIIQLLLIREFLIKFYGNELSLGIILANWLILEAAGAFFIGKITEYIKQKIEAFIILQLIFSSCLPLAIYLIRILNMITGLMAGEGFGIIGIFWVSFILALPICLTHGALFTFGCNIYSQIFNNSNKTAGKVYAYSACGTLIGGVIFTYLLIGRFNSFQIAFFTGLLNIFSAFILLGMFFRGGRPLAAKITGYVLIILLFINFVFLLKTRTIHLYSLKRQWPGQEVAFYGNSIYGNVAVLERDNQYTFLSNGAPIFTSPTPDIITTEELANFSLLSHPSPKNILVISGAAGGIINEMLKHPIETIDYCEIDPLIIRAAQRFSTSIIQAELSDKRVRINYTDGRLFLKNTLNKYDVIMVGIHTPSDLQTNRLFSEEFFMLAKYKLRKHGLMVLGLSGSQSYLSEELKKLNRCIYDTLKRNLAYMSVIPGDMNVFIGSDSPLRLNSGLMINRLRHRELNTFLITPAYIRNKLDKHWLNWFGDSIKNTKSKINKDFYPAGVFYSLSYWNSLFSPKTQKAFKHLEKINAKAVILIIIAMGFLYMIIASKMKRLKLYSIIYAIATTGFCAIIFDLIMIFALQIIYGYVYYWIGILITAFMAGLAIGSAALTWQLEKINNHARAFIWLEVAIAAFTLMLPFVLINSKNNTAFILLAFLSGFLVAAEFPLANKIYLDIDKNISQTAGFLYAADLIGGWLGGILAAVVFIPLLGLFNTCAVIITFKISSLIMMAFANR